ncbi:MAG: CPBP family intramembrane glutamic endopeptidase [Gemmatimonadaceae bacterium]
MTARGIFVGSEHRLRAPWRIVIFLAAIVPISLVVASLGGAAVSVAGAFGMRLIIFSWVSAVTLLAATFVSVRWVDRTSWSFVRLGSRAARPSVIASGALMGAIAIGVPSVMLLLAGEMRVVPDAPGSWGATALRAAFLLLPAALFEELLLRGYIFAVLRQSIGWKWTLIVTSVVFGLMHLNNPGVTPESILLVIVAGFFLGTIVLVTESVYAAWAAHFAWNWTMAGALHTAVSGLGLTTPNYRVVDSGPDWLTGGAWGPEGGVAAGLGMFVFLFYMFGRNLHRMDNH